MGFKFGNNDLQLEIGEEKFNVPYSAALVNRIREFGNKAIEQTKEMKENNDGTESMDKASNLLVETIDNVCGKGATDKIFGDREKNYYDLLDIVEYITDEVAKYKATQNNRYLNRAQRRAAR